MRPEFAILLLALAIGQYGASSEASVMRFFRVPWHWFGYAEEELLRELPETSDSTMNSELPPPIPYVRPPLRRMGAILPEATTADPEADVDIVALAESEPVGDIVALPEAPAEEDPDKDMVVDVFDFETTTTTASTTFAPDTTTVATTEASESPDSPTTTERTTMKETTTTAEQLITATATATATATVTETSEARTETEAADTTTITTGAPTLSTKLLEILKGKIFTEESKSSLAPVFRPELHLNQGSTTPEDQDSTRPASSTSGNVGSLPELRSNKPQFLYHGDWAAELHRLYYSKPIFETNKPIEEEEANKRSPISFTGRSAQNQ